MNTKNNRGDTIVEVVIAFSVFAAISVAVIMLMNRGLGIAQRSLETTLVRQQIDAQADLLRFARDEQSTLWNTILAKKMNGASAPASADTLMNTPNACSTPPQASFSLHQTTPNGPITLKAHANGASYGAPGTQAYVDMSKGVSYGIWMEIIDAQGSNANSTAYDIYIRGCWYTPGSDRPMVSGTVVRLYGA